MNSDVSPGEVSNNYDSLMEYDENEILSDRVNVGDNNIDNLIYETKINVNVGNSINEYLSSTLDKENIYEKILNKLNEKQESLTNIADDNNRHQEKVNLTESKNEQTDDIDLEKFYENRQSLYEDALLRKSSTIKHRDSHRNKNKENTNNSKINTSTHKTNITPRRNEEDPNKFSENFIKQTSVRDKLTGKNMYDGITAEKSEKFKSNNKNNKSLFRSNSIASSNTKKNITNYEDYKNSHEKSSKVKQTPNQSFVKNYLQKSVDRITPKSISRTYSDRLLALNRSNSEKKLVKNSSPNILSQNKSLNLKIVNDSIEEMIDVEKVENISLSMLRSSHDTQRAANRDNYHSNEIKIKTNENSYKNIHDSRKYLQTSINSQSTRHKAGKNSSENYVNMFRNNANPSRQTVTKTVEIVHPAKLLVKEDNKKTKPIAALSRVDRGYKANTGRSLEKVNNNLTEDLRVGLSNCKDNNVDECEPNTINQSIDTYKQHISNKNKSINDGEKLSESTYIKNRLSCDTQENPASQIYVKPRLANRLNKSYSTEKNNRNSNVFEEFYQKNLNWKKTIQDDLKVLKQQKEMDELKQCSFTPKVSDSTKKILSRNNQEKQEDFYQKNLKWKSKIEKFKQDEFVEKERKEFEECVFKPNQNSMKKINKLDDSSMKLKADHVYEKNIQWLQKVNENKKIKQLEFEEEFKEKPKHPSIRDRIDRSRSKSRGHLKLDPSAFNAKNNGENYLDEHEAVKIESERQKLKEDLSVINVRSNCLSSASSLCNNFSVLSREMDNRSLEKEMKELKELVKSLADTIEENKKITEENFERISDRSMKTTNNNFNLAVNQSFKEAVNDVSNLKRENVNDTNIKDIRNIKRVYSVENIGAKKTDYKEKYETIMKKYNDHKRNIEDIHSSK